jgi:tellurite resistance protein
MALDQSLLERIASSLRTSRASLPPGLTGEGGGAPSPAKDSILARAAELYAVRPGGEEDTPPTGFDPAAAALFEALVEGAFLIANADGEFDRDERAAFEHVVLSATGNPATGKRIAESQLSALLEDLGQLLAEDGIEKRIDVVAKTVAKPEQQREVLRVAALIGYISGGVSQVERTAMTKLAGAFGLGADAVDGAIGEAQRALDATA